MVRERFAQWAEQIGPIQRCRPAFSHHVCVEQQGYKACMALLKLNRYKDPLSAWSVQCAWH
jgi:hypothetical protein